MDHSQGTGPQPPPVACPKCRSQQVTANKAGFGVGKAVVGGLLLGPLGLAAGAHGSGKITVSCMACGHQWDPSVKPPPKTSILPWLLLIGGAVLFGSCFIAMGNVKRGPPTVAVTPTSPLAPANVASASATPSASASAKPKARPATLSGSASAPRRMPAADASAQPAPSSAD